MMKKWTNFTDFTCSRNGFCSLIFNDELYILGGTNSSSERDTAASVICAETFMKKIEIFNLPFSIAGSKIQFLDERNEKN